MWLVMIKSSADDYQLNIIDVIVISLFSKNDV